ncbi:hypothetical protein LUZ60_016260 [Juncus effusus]|nr:hypothetical protein LUZ60_016260 [Juncus effusus]
MMKWLKNMMKPWLKANSLSIILTTFICAFLTFSSFRSEYAIPIITPPVNKYLLNATFSRLVTVDKGAATVKNDAEELLRNNFSIAPAKYHLSALESLRDWLNHNYFEPEIMSQLVELVKRPIDLHNGLGSDNSKRYNSCAVVGNSGILLNSNYGELIDSHEFVIRINNAPTRGYPDRVGSKTNLSFMNSNVFDQCSVYNRCFCRSYDKQVPIVMYICQARQFINYAACKNSSETLVIVTDPRFDMLCARLVKYYSLKQFVEETGKTVEEWMDFHDREMFHYSSGLQAVMLALGVCDRVSLFGFGKDVGAKHHYHTRQKAELDLHDYEAEYMFYRDLVEQPDVVPFLNGVSGFRVPPFVVYH